MGDVCQPFYYDALGLEKMTSKRRALRVILAFLNILFFLSKLMNYCL